MTDSDDDLIAPLLEALLLCLDELGSVARRLHPRALRGLAASMSAPLERLNAAMSAQAPWPVHLGTLGRQLDLAANETVSALTGLQAAARSAEPMPAAYRALRHMPRALEALYPLAGLFAPVNRFFLDPARRDDEALQRRTLVPSPDNTGLMAFGDASDSRQVVWVYVPETAAPEGGHPLIMALHGGGGRGRGFLWSWLRDARTRGAILVAPTSLGPTWALTDDDHDTPHLAQILDFVRSQWPVDPTRVLLTGMSDGGTFAYVSGLQPESPFTHLAPVSAAFHPMLAEMADGARLRRLPIHIVHGALDWMFPVDMARGAASTLQAAGADVTYREVADLSHVYPVELNGAILDWMDATPGKAGLAQF
ncbi:MAG TPA: hypothetical protein PK359_06985 [Burkholderiaceae bacterium]|jgi:phospholipase/carboxylesterase|nr:hypothetical protein [Burkholderiaceae bacterium]